MRVRGTRGVATVVALAAITMSGCGDQTSGDPDAVRVDGLTNLGSSGPGIVANPPGGATPYQTPTYETPQLDRTELDANLAALAAPDKALADHYLGAGLGEGTWIVAAPMTVDEARLRLLGPSPAPAKQQDFVSANSSAYAFVQVGDGVLAWEATGFADPPERLLAELSRDGAVSAVVTDNIEAMTRFGYARDGAIVFDEYEYAFIDSLDAIPAEVRDLARLAWEDVHGPLVETADWASVGMAMAEKVTGVRATPEVTRIRGRENWYAVPLPWGAGE